MLCGVVLLPQRRLQEPDDPLVARQRRHLRSHPRLPAAQFSDCCDGTDEANCADTCRADADADIQRLLAIVRLHEDGERKRTHHVAEARAIRAEKEARTVALKAEIAAQRPKTEEACGLA
jgi:hypothetical protein